MLPLLAQVSVSLQTQFNIIFIQPAARMLTYFYCSYHCEGAGLDS